jgi:UDP-N-acetylmuramoyl-L-alanyl-D-glutamate--2,6-diaminopimelate ligase
MCKEAIMRQTLNPSEIFSARRDDRIASSAGDANDQFSLAAILPESRFFAGEDICFRQITEAAAASAGDLVVYRIGEGSPEQLIADAMARGAAGIVTEQLLPCPLPQCIVGNVELAMAQITAAMSGHPDRKLLTVGVIGPAGKTTTTLLIASLLRSHGIRSAYQTDLGECDGVVQETSEAALPTGASLVEWLSEANDSQCLAAIVELSDSAARHGHYDSIQFDLLIVTGSLGATADFGPSSLHCALERLAPRGVVIAPADDPKAMRVVRDSGVRMLTYGVRHAADLTAKIIDQADGMTTLMVTHHDTTSVMETTLCGAAMAANHAAAAMVGLLIELELPQIVETLSKLRVVPGRGERLDSLEHATAIIDAGGSTDRCTSALRTARSMKGAGRLWCVFAADCNDDPQQLARYGGLLERFATDVVITVAGQQQASFLKASHALLDGVDRCAAMRLVANRERAVRWAVAEAKPADTILILGGIDGQNAQTQRTKIEQVKNWIEAERAHAATEISNVKPSLKVFNG